MTDRPSPANRRAALVIEDDLIVAWAVEEIFRRAGIGEIVVAGSASAAKEAARMKTFDLILADLDLGPRSADGLAALRAIDPQGDTPTIIHSGYDRDDLAARGLTIDPAYGWLRKPATEDELWRLARGALDAAQRRERDG